MTSSIDSFNSDYNDEQQSQILNYLNMNPVLIPKVGKSTKNIKNSNNKELVQLMMKRNLKLNKLHKQGLRK